MMGVKLKDTFDVVDDGDDVLGEEISGAATDVTSWRALELSVDLWLLFRGLRQVPTQMPLTLNKIAGAVATKTPFLLASNFCYKHCRSRLSL